MSDIEPIIELEYDSNCNIIHYKDSSSGVEHWCEYDTNYKCIYFRQRNKDESWYESWREFDINGKERHYKNSDGYEAWWDSDGHEIDKPQR